MIKLEKVSYSYDQKPFIQNVEVCFEKGKITSLIGPNGCGKSTMIKLASRLLEPKSGKILMNGQDIKTIGRREYAKMVSVLPQGNYPLQIQVESIVMAGRYPYHSFTKYFTKEDKSIVDNAMKVTGCESMKDKEINKLSGGERQKVFIAMALAQDTDIIFFDEPTTYLDINISQEIIQLIVKLNKELGKTIIMVLHDLNMALNYSHDIILMENGRIIAQKAVGEIAGSGHIDRIFNVKTKCFAEENKRYYFFDITKDGD